MTKVKDSEEFTLLLKALSQDIVNAHIHYRLYRDLCDSLRDHVLVKIQSNTFWSLTLNAHLSACIHSLCRVYDQNDKALHLRSWLLTIRDNLHLFDIENFKDRVQGNLFVESLVQSPRKPDANILTDDIEKCGSQDSTVKVLIIHRNSRIAHANASNIVAELDIMDRHPLTHKDVEQLLDRAITILNRYSNLFYANIYSTAIVGHDDYQYIFKCVEEAVLRSRHARLRE